MDQTARRRIATLSGYFDDQFPCASASPVQVAAQDPQAAVGLGRRDCSAASSSAYASATGQPTTYERVHGKVSREPAVWSGIHSVHKESLQEVKYEKAAGEGIAKVCVHCLWTPLEAWRTGGRLLFWSARQGRCLAAAPHRLRTPSQATLSSPRLLASQPDMSLLLLALQITINRPHKRNAFTPRTVHEMSLCFTDARDDPAVGVIVLTGEGQLAFCSGGDQDVRGKGGYVGTDGVPRLNVLDLQMQIRRLPKPVIAMVAGYAVGGGHILHMICDLTVSPPNAMRLTVY